jgi:hypothetical protein
MQSEIKPPIEHDILHSDEEDVLVTDLIAQLQNIIASTPEGKRGSIKCQVRSYWTNNGGYLKVYVDGD